MRNERAIQALAESVSALQKSQMEMAKAVLRNCAVSMETHKIISELAGGTFDFNDTGVSKDDSGQR